MSVGVNKTRARRLSQRLADGCFAGACWPHDDDGVYAAYIVSWLCSVHVLVPRVSLRIIERRTTQARQLLKTAQFQRLFFPGGFS